MQKGLSIDLEHALFRYFIIYIILIALDPYHAPFFILGSIPIVVFHIAYTSKNHKHSSTMFSNNPI